MRFTQEEWEALESLQNGVQIVKAPGYGDDDWTHVLFVDGESVWTDGQSEPEDILLSRDLSSFVRAIQKLAAERDALKLHPSTVVMKATEFNDMVEDYDEKLRVLRERAEKAEEELRRQVEQ